jgi:hypothetical protein
VVVSARSPRNALMMRSRTGCSSRSTLAIPGSLAAVYIDAIIHKSVIGNS